MRFATPILALTLSLATGCSFFVSAKPQTNNSGRLECESPATWQRVDVVLTTISAIALVFAFVGVAGAPDGANGIGVIVVPPMLSTLGFGTASVHGRDIKRTCRSVLRKEEKSDKEKSDKEKSDKEKSNEIIYDTLRMRPR